LEYEEIEDKLNISLKESGWEYTKAGVIRLSARVIKNQNSANGLLFFLPDVVINNMTANQMFHLEIIETTEGKDYVAPITKRDGTFLSEKSIERNYGIGVSRLIKNIPNSPEEEGISIVKLEQRMLRLRGMEGKDLANESQLIVDETFTNIGQQLRFEPQISNVVDYSKDDISP
jgi:hypothetical protein